ncbi:MAG: type II toxin-antitoxin system Phd/YefM family antitoxin [Chloroflexi bacterium]|nr:type II toxin-antitoxin system Phd/YefM family antitoxin [Chloroflexota bacterium]
MTATLDTAHMKARLSEVVGRVAYGRERLVVLRRGKPMAALVSVEDLRRLEALDTAENNVRVLAVHPIMRAFGGWAGRDDLDDLVAEIYADRAAATSREVAL